MKPRMVWLALACLLGSGGSLLAQTRAITGTVTDSTTGGPIAGAAITVVGTRLGVNAAPDWPLRGTPVAAPPRSGPVPPDHGPRR